MIKPTVIRIACCIFTSIVFITNLSANEQAILADLKASIGSLSPKFTPNHKNYTLKLETSEAVVSFLPIFSNDGYVMLSDRIKLFSDRYSSNQFVDEGKNVFEFFVYSRKEQEPEKYTLTVERKIKSKHEREVPVLIVYVDFEESLTKLETVKSRENVWSELIFGNNRGQGNHYWSEVSKKQFKLVPAIENSGTENDGFVYVNLKTDQTLRHKLLSKNNKAKVNAEDWLEQTLALVSKKVNFNKYDKNKDLTIQNTELSLLFVLDLKARKVDGAGAQANIPLSHFLDGVKIEKYARTLSSYTTVGVNLHELAHHIFELDHLMEPKGFSLMGIGYNNQSNHQAMSMSQQIGTNPAHLSGYSKVRANFVEPILITETTLGIKLHKTTSERFNVIKIPVLDGFVYLENKQPDGYDSGVPFYRSQGGIFASEVVVTERMLNHTFGKTEDYAIKDYQSFKGHQDSFSIGGFDITNISQSADIMTFDIYKNNKPPRIEKYFYQYWSKDRERQNYRVRNNAIVEEKTIAEIDFRDFPEKNRFITVNSLYNTGEIRQVTDLTWSTKSQYLKIKPLFMNRDKVGLYHALTLKFEFNASAMYENSVTVKFIHNGHELLLRLVNLPES